jgi:hypothetical protein
MGCALALAIDAAANAYPHGPKVFRAAQEGHALEYLSHAICACAGDLNKFIKQHSEDGR